MVVMAFVNELHDPCDASRKYTTTGVDIFRIAHGRIVEHWDPYELRFMPELPRSPW